jgi:hypothetical protein
MAQVLGLIQATFLGVKYDVKKGSKVKLGGLLQKGVVIGQQVDFSQEFDMSEVSVKTRLKKGQSLKALYPQGQGELQILCDTGQTFAWSDAFITNLPELTGGTEGGDIEIKLAGGVPSELVN